MDVLDDLPVAALSLSIPRSLIEFVSQSLTSGLLRVELEKELTLVLFFFCIFNWQFVEKRNDLHDEVKSFTLHNQEMCSVHTESLLFCFNRQ